MNRSLRLTEIISECATLIHSRGIPEEIIALGPHYQVFVKQDAERKSGLQHDLQVSDTDKVPEHSHHHSADTRQA